MGRNDYIAHFGVSKANGAKVGSGRYPLGSGLKPQSDNNKDLKEKIKNLNPFYKKKKEKEAKVAALEAELKATGERLYRDYHSDETVPAGELYERIETKTDKRDPYKSKRIYVSKDAGDYWNDYFVGDVNKTTVQYLKTDKETRLAGADAINKILKEIGSPGLEQSRRDKAENITFDDDLFATDDNRSKVSPDFLMNDKELGSKFIDQAIKDGYGGVKDLADLDIGFSSSPRIFFNGFITKYDEKPLAEVW